MQTRDSIKQLDSLLEHCASSVLKPWQQELLDVCQETSCQQKIHWLWESNGNVEKGWIPGGPTTVELVMEQPFWRLKRTNKTLEVQHKHYLDGTYSLADDMKNGQRLVNTKYESKSVFFKQPHVIFLAKIEHDFTKWSRDSNNVTLGLIPPLRKTRQCTHQYTLNWVYDCCQSGSCNTYKQLNSRGSPWLQWRAVHNCSCCL